MMMHIGKKLYRSVAVLCALVLSFGLVFSDCMVAHASTDSVDVQLPKLMDIALTAQGVVASPAVLDSVSDALVARVQDSLDAVYNAMVSAGETTWNNVSSYISECVEDYTLQKILNAYIESVKDYGFMLPVVTAVDVATALSPNEHGGSGRERGKTYTLDEEFVDTINDVFQIWWTENEDYFIWRVPAFSELSTDYFESDNYTFVDNFFEAIAEPNKVYYLQSQNKGQYGVFTPQLVLGVVSNPDYYFYTDTTALPNGNAYVYPYYDGLQQQVDLYGYYADTGSFCLDLHLGIDSGLSILDLELASNGYDSVKLFYTYETGTVGEYSTFSYIYHGLVARNAFNIRLFKDNESADDFVVDDQTVYYTPDYNPDNNIPVTYTGDYYIDNAVIYNYNIVQETIDNSSTIDNSVVNEIVDNSVTEITNNYDYVEPEETIPPSSTEEPGDDSNDDSDGSSDGSDNPLEGVLGGVGEVLGNIIGVLDDLLALALGFITDAANTILNMFSSIINLVNTLREETSGLSGALSEFFPYIPEEIWDILTATITIICGLALINWLRGK